MVQQAFPQQALGSVEIVQGAAGFRELDECFLGLVLKLQCLPPVALGPLEFGQIHARMSRVHHESDIALSHVGRLLQKFTGPFVIVQMG